MSTESERRRHHSRLARGSIGGEVSETTNVIPFPLMVRPRRAAADGRFRSGPGEYEFTEDELAGLDIPEMGVYAYPDLENPAAVAALGSST